MSFHATCDQSFLGKIRFSKISTFRVLQPLLFSLFDEVAQSCAIIFGFAQITFPSSSSHFD
ncbi:hypothetical protein T10_3223 [Trichinella papuae]|uniref:Uncharacterized protein n=1 Tax=Trichinella papuae TaxID=268474 RepID=A0A0V1M235_9BILA|nr:hypothetical protein T10_3223 [Trichinella papuae]